jgi:hypothetical protein
VDKPLARISNRGAKREHAEARRYKTSSRIHPSGAREAKHAGVLDTRTSTLSKRNAVDSGEAPPVYTCGSSKRPRSDERNPSGVPSLRKSTAVKPWISAKEGKRAPATVGR